MQPVLFGEARATGKTLKRRLGDSAEPTNTAGQSAKFSKAQQSTAKTLPNFSGVGLGRPAGVVPLTKGLTKGLTLPVTLNGPAEQGNKDDPTDGWMG
ncbi:Protein of unknown function [Pyronema omphalodes CBS 100304]|uniref:Uncharacterized protein n=1 Tax=Pyronema omphalodes (strain CBS 100304) TaxID=1076935 RepID=U4LNM0_PYROM|nr:Protein of unknown function [Pyronema omphalodes CBS 100304]